jgi:TldD protein
MEEHSMAISYNTQDIFFNTTNLSQAAARDSVLNALHPFDDGELFLEHKQSEFLVWEDGQLKNSSYDLNQGFALRGVAEDRVRFAHSNTISESSLKNLMQSISSGESTQQAQNNEQKNLSFTPLYSLDNPVSTIDFKQKIELLQNLDAYTRALDVRIRQVTLSLLTNWQVVHIIRADGLEIGDIRPLTRFHIVVVLEKDGG